MSWSARAVGRKDKAKAALEAHLDRMDPAHVPVQIVKGAVAGLLERFPPDRDGLGVDIETTGHIDNYGGAAVIKIQSVPLAE